MAGVDVDIFVPQFTKYELDAQQNASTFLAELKNYNISLDLQQF